jgi:transglutaminase/protease-like cytokinesis protein 3
MMIVFVSRFSLSMKKTSALLRMKIILTSFFLFAALMNAAAQSKDYSKIDTYAIAKPEMKAVTVDGLTKYLMVPAKGDSEKVRSIFMWITSHITYDWDAYENGTAQWQDAVTTIQRRKGVCQNFSDLFTALCISAGLDAQTISGYAKSNIDNSWMLAGFGSVNHAWNVVKVSGKWQLMDVTWSHSTGSFNYFMADPLLFRRDHLPWDAQWQLTKDTLTLEQYEHIPQLKDGYYTFHVQHLTPMTSSIKGKKKMVFAFDSKNDLHLTASVYHFDYSNRSVPKFVPVVTHSGNHYTLTLTFADEDTYWVTIQDQNAFGAIISYVVDTHATGN